MWQLAVPFALLGKYLKLFSKSGKMYVHNSILIGKEGLYLHPHANQLIIYGKDIS